MNRFENKAKMKTEKLPAPKRRRKVRLTNVCPLPIPSNSSTGSTTNFSNWNYFTGMLQGDAVIIKHSGDMQMLYSLGFFGKGSLSQHEPVFASALRKYEHAVGEKCYSVMSSRKYMRHMHWADPEGTISIDTNEKQLSPVCSSSLTDTAVEAHAISNPHASHSTRIEEYDKEHVQMSTGSNIPFVAEAGDMSSSSGKVTHTDDPWDTYDLEESESFWLTPDTSESLGQSPGIKQTDSVNSMQQNFIKTNSDHNCSDISGSICEGGKDNGSGSSMNDAHSDGDMQSEKRSKLVSNSDGNVLVIDNPLSLITGLKSEVSVKTQNCFITQDPVELHENLQLCLEESFFLCFGLGCLLIHEEGKNAVLNVDELWQKLVNTKPRFPFTYAAYHHYRSLGWVPKPGLKFGGDFVLYRTGPPFYHSTYVVIVRNTTKQNMKSKGGNLFGCWSELTAHSRVVEQVSKDLLICQVVQPEYLTLKDLQSSASHLSRLAVQDILIQRWVSKTEMDNLQFVDIP